MSVRPSLDNLPQQNLARHSQKDANKHARNNLTNANVLNGGTKQQAHTFGQRKTTVSEKNATAQNSTKSAIELLQKSPELRGFAAASPAQQKAVVASTFSLTPGANGKINDQAKIDNTVKKILALIQDGDIGKAKIAYRGDLPKGNLGYFNPRTGEIAVDAKLATEGGAALRTTLLEEFGESIDPINTPQGSRGDSGETFVANLQRLAQGKPLVGVAEKSLNKPEELSQSERESVSKLSQPEINALKKEDDRLRGEDDTRTLENGDKVRQASIEFHHQQLVSRFDNNTKRFQLPEGKHISADELERLRINEQGELDFDTIPKHLLTLVKVNGKEIPASSPSKEVSGVLLTLVRALDAVKQDNARKAEERREQQEFRAEQQAIREQQQKAIKITLRPDKIDLQAQETLAQRRDSETGHYKLPEGLYLTQQELDKVGTKLNPNGSGNQVLDTSTLPERFRKKGETRNGVPFTSGPSLEVQRAVHALHDLNVKAATPTEFKGHGVEAKNIDYFSLAIGDPVAAAIMGVARQVIQERGGKIDVPLGLSDEERRNISETLTSIGFSGPVPLSISEKLSNTAEVWAYELREAGGGFSQALSRALLVIMNEENEGRRGLERVADLWADTSAKTIIERSKGGNAVAAQGGGSFETGRRWEVTVQPSETISTEGSLSQTERFLKEALGVNKPIAEVTQGDLAQAVAGDILKKAGFDPNQPKEARVANAVAGAVVPFYSLGVFTLDKLGFDFLSQKDQHLKDRLKTAANLANQHGAAHDIRISGLLRLIDGKESQIVPKEGEVIADTVLEVFSSAVPGALAAKAASRGVLTASRATRKIAKLVDEVPTPTPAKSTPKPTQKPDIEVKSKPKPVETPTLEAKPKPDTVTTPATPKLDLSQSTANPKIDNEIPAGAINIKDVITFKGPTRNKEPIDITLEPGKVKSFEIDGMTRYIGEADNGNVHVFANNRSGPTFDPTGFKKVDNESEGFFALTKDGTFKKIGGLKGGAPDAPQAPVPPVVHPVDHTNIANIAQRVQLSPNSQQAAQDLANRFSQLNDQTSLIDLVKLNKDADEVLDSLRGAKQIQGNEGQVDQINAIGRYVFDRQANVRNRISGVLNDANLRPDITNTILPLVERYRHLPAERVPPQSQLTLKQAVEFRSQFRDLSNAVQHRPHNASQHNAFNKIRDFLDAKRADADAEINSILDANDNIINTIDSAVHASAEAGHGHRIHGHQTTAQDQIDRIEKQVNPGPLTSSGHKPRNKDPVDSSSRYFNTRAETEAILRAKQALVDEYGGTLARPNPPGNPNKDLRKQIVIDRRADGSPFGQGWSRDNQNPKKARYRGTKDSALVVVQWTPRVGRPGTGGWQFVTSHPKQL